MPQILLNHVARRYTLIDNKQAINYLITNCPNSVNDNKRLLNELNNDKNNDLEQN